MEVGSLRGVVIVWIRMTMGVGILTIPKLIKEIGIIPGIIFLILGCLICYFSYSSIFFACVKTQIKGYAELVNHLLPGTISNIFKYSYFLDMMCFTTVYSIFGWRLFEFLLRAFNLMKPEWFNQEDTLDVKEYHP